MQHVQDGGDASGPHAAASWLVGGSGGAVRRHALCMPTHLPYSKCLSVRGGDLDFGRDYDGQVEGTGVGDRLHDPVTVRVTGLGGPVGS
jgi:hypothetical protein